MGGADGLGKFPGRRLFRRLKEEAASDQGLSEYIRELEIFTRHVEGEEVIGLEGKLKVSGRDDQLDMAMAVKEMVFSQLNDNIFSPAFSTNIRNVAWKDLRII
jgi:hypothetical protein